MRTTWIVQTSTDSQSPADLRRACAAEHLPFYEISWEHLLAEGADRAGERIFVKPNDDLKHFTGEVLTFGEAAGTYERLVRAGAPIGPTSEVVIAAPREVDAEWRLFVVDGEVVSGSMYRPSGDPQLPSELVGFAEESARRWAPAPVFVMDVARVEGTWKIVECNSAGVLGPEGADGSARSARTAATGADEPMNCFNGSRFYLADVGHIVRAVSAHQENAL